MTEAEKKDVDEVRGTPSTDPDHLLAPVLALKNTPASTLPMGLTKIHPILHLKAVFVPDDVNDIIKETVDGVLQSQDYSHPLVGQWTNDVVATCVRRLTSLGKPFKYVVTCVIMQRTGAGLHTASSCYWDTETDGSRTVRWENKTMYCIVSVFGLAI